MQSAPVAASRSIAQASALPLHCERRPEEITRPDLMTGGAPGDAMSRERRRPPLTGPAHQAWASSPEFKSRSVGSGAGRSRRSRPGRMISAWLRPPVRGAPVPPDPENEPPYGSPPECYGTSQPNFVPAV
jgi:hypothetical protein